MLHHHVRYRYREHKPDYRSSETNRKSTIGVEKVIPLRGNTPTQVVAPEVTQAEFEMVQHAQDFANADGSTMGGDE